MIAEARNPKKEAAEYDIESVENQDITQNSAAVTGETPRV